MELQHLSAHEYGRIFGNTATVFHTAAFNELNASKCEQLYLLAFKDSKYRLGLIAGLRNGMLHTPFSAPFGGFSAMREDISIGQLEAATDLLTDFARTNHFNGIRYTMPPLFYQETFLNKVLNVLPRKGFRIGTLDINYQFRLSRLTEQYEAGIWHNARKNIRIAREQGYSFHKANTLEEKQAAYEVIRENRQQRGFPLRMTWEQVAATIELIPADFFLLRNAENQHVAAAVVFHVTPQIVQVIYWGDIPAFATGKPMNLLSYEVFRFYRDAGFLYADIGPSTEDGIPNYGLCEFKEGIGCELNPKTTFYWEP